MQILSPYFGPPPDGMRMTFEAFVEFIASNPGDIGHNPHWETIHSRCSPCAMDFNLITHLEKSEEEIDTLLKEIGLFGKIKISSKYNWANKKHHMTKKEPEEQETIRAPDEAHWKDVPKQTAIEIYKHYFLHFVIFGYSTQDFLK